MAASPASSCPARPCAGARPQFLRVVVVATAPHHASVLGGPVRVDVLGRQVANSEAMNDRVDLETEVHRGMVNPWGIASGSDAAEQAGSAPVLRRTCQVVNSPAHGGRALAAPRDASSASGGRWSPP
eukprot:scaffold156177_cov31-Tisochrysis_lutea.AAC.5